MAKARTLSLPYPRAKAPGQFQHLPGNSYIIIPMAFSASSW